MWQAGLREYKLHVPFQNHRTHQERPCFVITEDDVPRSPSGQKNPSISAAALRFADGFRGNEIQLNLPPHVSDVQFGLGESWDR
jgi:hypothetical protein